ncbi:DOMON-like domain-containing protein [Nostoc sp. 'Peltigera membranacea cyanobiont' N6]|uniref:DOMON-like domain-containing protein n=1 Tax=Nostoc sp. 'Peltigera membranacea cyanobiont' N6 TaxID=1261031 RepID=UPI000CF33DE5|nr:DOMON-like domain-containing protein [Nostoc sp. 'Peltigera membranacea cyanobiont' N6]AVH66940.1 DOMON-like domain protein [Nostoc sp. 'Peltigera membranacea cyanobiont' N6]
MNEQTFSLQPFPSNESPPNLKISGNIARNGNKLAIHYMVEGDLKEIAIVSPSNTPSRKHELWKDTCFEFFLGIKNSAQYWEFNLSPAGHWNAYRLDGYRQRMQEEIAFENLAFNVQNQANGLVLALDVDLDKIVSAEQAIEVGITTVIKYRNDEVTYWALTHRGVEADFHLRDTFIVKL